MAIKIFIAHRGNPISLYWLFLQHWDQIPDRNNLQDGKFIRLIVFRGISAHCRHENRRQKLSGQSRVKVLRYKDTLRQTVFSLDFGAEPKLLLEARVAKGA